MIFVDSGFFIALFDPSDESWAGAHKLLSEYRSDHQVTLATAQDVFNELLAHFSRSGPELRQQVARFVHLKLGDGKFRVKAVDRQSFSKALLLYERRLDKRYSMVDCIGMTIMRRDGIDEVVTTDRDFVQEGSTNVMR